MTADERRRALLSVRLACPLGCRTLLAADPDAGPAGDRRTCPRCRVVVVLPRAPFAAAARRVGWSIPR